MSWSISESGAPLLQRLGELVLRVLERLLRIGEIAVLDAQRQLPHAVDDVLQALARGVAVQPADGGAHAEIDRGGIDEAFRLDGQRLHRPLHERHGARVIHELGALLDDGARQRLVELPLRQDELHRLGAADVAGDVLGLEREDDGLAGIGVRAEIDVGLRLLLRGARQAQGNLRRLLVAAAADL